MVHPAQPMAWVCGFPDRATHAICGTEHRHLRHYFSGWHQNQRIPASHVLDAPSWSFGISDFDDTARKFYWKCRQRSGVLHKLRLCRMADFEVFLQKPADQQHPTQ